MATETLLVPIVPLRVFVPNPNLDIRTPLLRVTFGIEIFFLGPSPAKSFEPPKPIKIDVAANVAILFKKSQRFIPLLSLFIFFDFMG